FGVGVAHGARSRVGEERSALTTVAYDDAWNGIDAFLALHEPRVAAMHAMLSERGTLYVHLDARAVHETKVLCDRVCGRDAFRGEIVWVPGNGSRTTKSWGFSHQTILVYTRDARPTPSEPRWIFNADDPHLREPFAQGSLALHFGNVDEEGRQYRERVIKTGAAEKRYRYYADDGRRLGTVWTDAPSMAANTPRSKETTGYPHQKPRKLLDRIVAASSVLGSTVGDFFCGSGTTLEAAVAGGRDAIGCDASALAIETTSKRLRAMGIDVTVTVT
ncbi:MAG: DNA methyltransferase, partial [Polyangiales bacterium]